MDAESIRNFYDTYLSLSSPSECLSNIMVYSAFLSTLVAGVYLFRGYKTFEKGQKNKKDIEDKFAEDLLK